MCLQAFTNHVFQATRVNASDGIPKVWDEKADGYVRGESVVCFLLQRRSEAKRIYATVLNSGVNIDGFKRMGMFFPSSEAQEELMIKVYKEANVDPLKVNYFEAHGTGTQVTIDDINWIIIVLMTVLRRATLRRRKPFTTPTVVT